MGVFLYPIQKIYDNKLRRFQPYSNFPLRERLPLYINNLSHTTEGGSRPNSQEYIYDGECDI